MFSLSLNKSRSLVLNSKYFVAEHLILFVGLEMACIRCFQILLPMLISLIHVKIFLNDVSLENVVLLVLNRVRILSKFWNCLNSKSFWSFNISLQEKFCVRSRKRNKTYFAQLCILLTIEMLTLLIYTCLTWTWYH